MELIDRGKLVSDFWNGVEDGSILSYEDTDNLMENAPTVDAVEVVRCEKCVHCINDEEEPGMCKCVESAEYESESGLWLGYVEYHTREFFCAFGERKDNG